jgi:hypothetical protein
VPHFITRTRAAVRDSEERVLTQPLPPWQLSRRCRQIVAGASRLQYTLELSKRRMVLLPPTTTGGDPGPSGSDVPVPYSQRLHRLRSREQAWHTCAWRHRANIPVPYHINVYEFSGGLYGTGTQTRGSQNAGIRLYRLPGEPTDAGNTTDLGNDVDGPLSGGQSKEASSGSGCGSEPKQDDPALNKKQTPLKLEEISHSMNMDIVDFTMDPSRDLLVVVELANDEFVAGSKNVQADADAFASPKYVYRIHFRTISTNEEHPQAGVPFVTAYKRLRGVPPSTLTAGDEPICIQISGDLLIFLVKNTLRENLGVPAVLQMWNWTYNHRHIACSVRCFVPLF